MATSTLPDPSKPTAEALQDALDEYDRLFIVHASRITAYDQAHRLLHRSSAVLYRLEREAPSPSPIPWLHENRKRYVSYLRGSAGSKMRLAREEIRVIRVEIKRTEELVRVVYFCRCPKEDVLTPQDYRLLN